jgi:hypothetical protein
MSQHEEVQLPALDDRNMQDLLLGDSHPAYVERCVQLLDARSQIAALTEQVETLTAESVRAREARRNHAETLRGIAKMDPATDSERMRQWARDGLSGYVATYEMTLREFEQRFEKAEALVKANAADASWARANRSKLADCEDALRKAEAELDALRERAEDAEGAADRARKGRAITESENARMWELLTNSAYAMKHPSKTGRSVTLQLAALIESFLAGQS